MLNIAKSQTKIPYVGILRKLTNQKTVLLPAYRTVFARQTGTHLICWTLYICFLQTEPIQIKIHKQCGR